MSCIYCLLRHRSPQRPQGRTSKPSYRFESFPLLPWLGLDIHKRGGNTEKWLAFFLGTQGSFFFRIWLAISHFPLTLSHDLAGNSG